MPPLWLVALIVAAAAPFCAAGLQAMLESRLQGRTRSALAKARSALERGEGERRSSDDAPAPPPPHVER
jgi:hypothetical protein